MYRSARYKLLGFVTLISFSLLLRVYGLNFPGYHWDENIDFNNVFSASFNHFALLTYVHGSLHPYLILIAWKLYLLLNSIAPTTSNLIFGFFEDPKPFLILARGLMVLASNGSVVLSFLVGWKLYNQRVGWISAVFLAGTFLHAAESHYARSHVLAAFFVIVGLYFCSRIMESGGQLDYVFAGVSLGLATAAQYSLIISIVPICLAHIFYIKKSKAGKQLSDFLMDRAFLVCMVIAAVTFLAVTPYAVIDPRRFAGEIKFIVKDVTHAWVYSDGQPVWLFFLSEHLRNGMGLVLFLMSIVGLIYASVRRTQSDILVVIFLLVSYFTVINSANFARYLIPSLPFWVILAARFLEKMLRFLERRFSRTLTRSLSVLAVIGILVQPILNIIRFDYWLTQPDTRQLAAEWIYSNIPYGSAIVVEGINVLGPNVPIGHKDLEQLLAIQPKGTLGYVYTKALFDSQSLDTGYTVLSVFRLDQKHESGMFDGAIDSASYYRDLGYDYLITSSWMQPDPTNVYSTIFQESLNQYYVPVKEFKPTIYFRFDPYSWRIDYQALRQVIPGKPGVGGPILTIFKLSEIGHSSVTEKSFY